MATKSITPIRGKRLRVTQLDDCGRFTGASLYLVTEGFVTVTLTPQVEDGNDIQVRNANGALCLNERGNPTFTGIEVEIEFCEVNPSLISFVTNANEYDNYAGEVAGFTLPEGEITGRFALELWTGIAGAACDSAGNEKSGYLLLPHVAAGTLGDLTIGGEDAITFSVSNSATRGGNTWGTGPFDVVLNDAEPAVAAPLPTALDPLDHFLMLETDVAPPVAIDTPVAIEP